MAIMVSRDKWILYKHTCSYPLIKAVALDVKYSCKSIVSELERHQILKHLQEINLYRPRNDITHPLDSINHRINTLEFWMFGYEDKVGANSKFIFSPLGNLFLKYINDEEKLRKIFISMLFALQFPHQANGTSHEFQIYPFRLIFKLLMDPRLSNRLYNYEEELLLPFIKKITPEEYERLVREILNLRNLHDDDLTALYMSDQHTYVNTVYEWEYYTVGLLSEIGVFDKTDGKVICKLYHPQKPSSKSAPTGRKATRGYISLPKAEVSYIGALLREYSCFDDPVLLNDPFRLTIDCIKEIYNFYPKILLDAIGESSELVDFLALPKLIEKYSKNPDNETAYLFEDVLTESFNWFYNVKAVKRGGAGHTDIECSYLTGNKKFAVECKSTSHKLPQINAGRLREQREEIGAAYTIVITPGYVPAVIRDIKNSPIVVILASTFAEYLYNYIANNLREIDFADLDNLITHNLGKDISELVSDLTLNRFAASSDNTNLFAHK